jgi:hypothetical protein
MNGFMRGNGAKESSKLNGDLMLIRLLDSPVVDLCLNRVITSNDSIDF